MPTAGGHEGEVRSWSERLDRHFGELRARRDRDAPGSPLFALEHGLAPDELGRFMEVLRSRATDLVGSEETAPAFAVYAAEFGYRYSGHEYWPSFEAETPGWRAHGDREYVRACLSRFSERFSGAKPSGAWAEHFTIISWPITHAVLPADLQRQLAKLLFDNRLGLTPDLLADPPSLGRHLAARNRHRSSRFEALAENFEVLGLICAALLAETQGRSPHLDGATLRRLVADLEQERQSRTWLRGARSVAERIRTRGVLVDSERAGGARPAEAGPGRIAISPRLGIEQRGGEWRAFVEVPDLSPLTAVQPDLGEEIARRRLIVAGEVERPESAETLAMPGLRLMLRRWPRSGVLFDLEGAPEDVNRTLAEACGLEGASPWLFRIASDGHGTEVRGRSVAPAGRYVIFFEAHPVSEMPAWVTPCAVAVDGIAAFTVDCPPAFGAEETSALGRLGLATVTEIVAEPAGLTAPAWDGSGRSEWLVGETPVFKITATKAVDALVCRSGADERRYPFAAGQVPLEVLLAFPGLAVGIHRFELLLDVEGLDAEEVGRLEIEVRRPLPRSASGGPREGMAIVASPADPTLEGLWAGRDSLLIQGPKEAKVAMSFELLDADRGSLARHRATVRLPVGPADWRALFEARFRHDAHISRCYEEAASGRIAISDARLGEAEIEYFRRFSALALRPGSDREGEFLRIENNTGEEVEIVLREFSHPDLPSPAEADSEGKLRTMTGGLVEAKAAGASATTIAVPTIRDLDDLQRLRRVPQLREQRRSAEAVRSLLVLARRWETADLPANPVAVAERRRVLEAVAQTLAALIGGTRWRSLERRWIRQADGMTVTELLGGVGSTAERSAALALRRRFDAEATLSGRIRIRLLAGALAADGPKFGPGRYETGFAETLLQLALSPGATLDTPEGTLRRRIDLVLKAPAYLRGLRFVLLTEPEEPDLE
jgi:hypothetical protein